MKTSNILWAAAAVLLAACNQEEPAATAPAAGNQVQMTFTANAPAAAADTRTSLVEGTKVYWEPGDVIGVYSCIPNTDEGYFMSYGGGTPFSTTLTEASPTATFTGTAEEGADKYIAIYPQDKFIGCMWWDTAGGYYTISFEIPTEQEAVAGSFANGLNLSWAETTNLNGSLTFKNLCALVKFSISGNANGLKSVTLTDLGEDIGLSSACNFEKVGDTENFIAQGDPTVTLTGDFETGKDYYFVVCPTAYSENYALQNGFSLTFTWDDDQTFVKTSTGGIDKQLAAGTILDLGEIEITKPQ